ncbi:MAG: hypothetical protein JW849_09620 [Phycisphaerae bacterium]|nr:hypothetical protein [Phycisphaerae bacterium]
MASMNILAALNILTGVAFPLWALGHCFFGYVLFRVLLAINGLAGGFFLGAYVIGLVRQPPTQADVWVAGIVGGVLLMLAAWFLYRAVFAAAAGLTVAAMILHFWPGGGTGAWILMAVAGVLAAGVVFVFLRELLAVVTALAGAAAAVVFVVDQWLWQGVPREWLLQDPPLTIGALIAFVLLAAAGLVVQLRTPRRLARRFGPPPNRRPAGNTNVRPKFTRV